VSIFFDKKFVKNERKMKGIKLRVTIDNLFQNLYNICAFLDSSMVEHTAVNRGVVGSSPTQGVKISDN
jgi:hypothetical protein